VGPNFDEEWDGMSHSHVVTRSVRDSAAMLDAVCGLETGSPYSAPAPERLFAEEVNIAPQKLRIGFYTRPAYGRDTHPECVKAIEKTCKLLASLGHQVEEVEPGYQEEDVAMDWMIIVLGNTAALVNSLIEAYGQSKVSDGLELTSLALYSVGRQLKAMDFVKAKRRWRQLGITMSQKLNQHDMLLTPTLGEPPVRVGSQQPRPADQRSMKLLTSAIGKILLSNTKLTRSILGELVHNSMKGQMLFTMIANLTGQPAMSVPLHWSENGLPCGVQFIGRYGDEANLLRLASQLEKAQPWIDRKPMI
jgi:amidase